MKLKSLALLTACLISNGVHASDDIKKNLYIGADYQFLMNDYYSTREYAESLHSGNINIGVRANKYFGLELGYFQSERGENSETLNINGGSGAIADYNTQTKTKGVSLDVIGYLPIDNNDIEIFVNLGLGFYKSEQQYLDNLPHISNGAFGYVTEKNNDTALRLGAGVQKQLNDRFSIRGGLRFDTSIAGDDFISNNVASNIGVRFHF